MLLKYLYPSRQFFIAIFFLFLFQLSYSLAPILLSLATQKEEVSLVVLFFLAYIALNFLPYVLSYLYCVFRNIWFLQSTLRIINALFQNYAYRISVLNNQKEENNFNALITNNAHGIIREYQRFLDSFLSDLFSSFLTILFLSYFILPQLVYYYMLSLGICFIVILLSKKRHEGLSWKTEQARNEFIGELSGSWLLTITEQEPFWSRKRVNINARWKDVFRKSISLTHFQQIINLIQACVIWLPTTLYLVSVIKNSSLREATAILVIVPRVIELLLDISNLAYKILGFNMHTGKLKWLDKKIHAYEPIDLPVSMKRIKIIIDGKDNRFDDLEDFYEFLGAKSSGRITISGENGSGKTNLLLKIKEAYKHDVFLFPESRSFLVDVEDELSIGQQKIRGFQALEDIAIAKNYKVFLLDEWNANLDESKTQVADGIIDELSKTAVVIEVLHHIR